MAGHSKWANIRFRKSLQDSRRGKLFTKYIREITIAARIAGGDPSTNPRLRSGIDKALTANMTRDTIERAISRGAGGGEGSDLEEIRYEGYAPGGVAVVVDCATDNRKRTVSEVRHAFSKHGGNLGTDGSVTYLFEHLGQLFFELQGSEDRLLEAALEAGAIDVISHPEGFEVQTRADDFHKVESAMKASGFISQRAELIMHPSIQIELTGEVAQKCLKLIDHLEDLDDVQAVYANAAWPDDLF